MSPEYCVSYLSLSTFGCAPKIVLAVKIAQRRQRLPPTLRHPFAKIPIAQGFDRDPHTLWETTNRFQRGVCAAHLLRTEESRPSQLADRSDLTI